MATPAENLATRYKAICTELATIQSQAVEHKSDAGASRKGTLQSYRLQLYDELAKITEALAALGYEVDAAGLSAIAGGDVVRLFVAESLVIGARTSSFPLRMTLLNVSASRILRLPSGSWM